jgi:CHAT domain-containing protein
MRHLAATAWLAFVVPALAGLPVDQPPPPAAPRELSRADVARSAELYAKAVALGREGKFAEARGPIREIADIRARVLGEGHFETADARRELETLAKLAALPEAGREEYRTTYVLSDRLNELSKQNRFDEAREPARQILDVYRRLLGPDASLVAVAAHRYGQVLYQAERFSEAETQFREALRVVRAVAGEDHPSVAAASGELAATLERLGQFAESRRLHETALAITSRLRGKNHPATAVSANNLACFLDRQALYADAEVYYRRAVSALRSRDDEAAKLATAYGNLALNLQHRGRYAEAEAVYRESLTLRVKLDGEDHPDTGQVYMNLATNSEARGDVAAAEPLLRKALANFRKAFGDNSPRTARVMSNLAANLDKQAKYAEAERLLREALQVVQRAPQLQARDVAVLSNNLASCLEGQEKYAEAGELCAKALAILREHLGPDHPDVAAALNNVAVNYHNQGKHPEAERSLREALEITRRRQGEGHADTAVARVNLAVNLHDQGKYDEAEGLFREALEAQRQSLGEGHPSTSWTYRNLALCGCARGEYARVAALTTAAAASFETARRRIGFGGLERAGRSADISPLPALAAAAARGGQPEVAWKLYEQDLARGLLDDLSARPLANADRSRERQILARLDDLDRRSPSPAAGSDELRRLREDARAEFVRFQADVAARYGVAAGEVYELARIQEHLPEDAALVAWLDLPHPGQARRADPGGDHWGCVVRRRGAPAWVRLRGSGADGAWTDDDARLTARARRAFAGRPTDGPGAWREVARRLAAQRLTPLEEHLKARPDLPAVQHLIVLPNSKMAGIPLEALTDRFTVSYAPSGTMFAWLIERSAGRAAPTSNLLALGDPVFQAPADAQAAGGKPPARDPGRREAFARLPGTRQEVLGVARVFSETRLLMGAQASEQSLERMAASGDLRAYRFLHFATHGVLDDGDPLRSALILAPEQVGDRIGRVLDGRDLPDGRLTAERILRRWKLDADLVTLSACETGVGKFSGGEGYVGFSQALFVAGARGLVLSLWQVEDAATALLMTRFYENLLGTPEGTVKPMSKALALAEAKRWLRGLGPDDVRELTKDLSKRGTRGRVERRPAGAPASTARTYEHPYYWAGFILIGDPR